MCHRRRQRTAIEFVNVALHSNAGLFRGAVTNRDGLYLLPSLPPGRYRLQASAVGYVTYTDTLDLAAGEVRILNFELRPAEIELGGPVVEAERNGSIPSLP